MSDNLQRAKSLVISEEFSANRSSGIGVDTIDNTRKHKVVMVHTNFKDFVKELTLQKLLIDKPQNS